MKKSLIAAAAAALLRAGAVRARTADISFGYRMGAGFPGDVNRTHPASILPRLMNAASPVRLYGDPGVIDAATNSWRALGAGDGALTKVDGVLVRPYPAQQMTGGLAAPIGAATPPGGNNIVDFLREGYVIARCNNFAAQQPAQGGAVYVWVAASAGAHVQGGFESAADGANTAGPITNLKWMGPTDSQGVTEIEVCAPSA